MNDWRRAGADMEDFFGFPCSFAQRRLWFLDRLTPQGNSYNIPGALRMDTHVDPQILQRAVNQLAQRHESLRTTFGARNGEPMQLVAAERDFTVALTCVQAESDAEREREALRLATLEARIPFDLERGPLLRVGLLRLSPSDHVLLVTMHHIISDGWSMEIFFRELATFYAAELDGRPAQLPELPIQYADYAAWERDPANGDRLRRQIDYWKRQLAQLPLLQMPADRPRPPVSSYRGGRETLQIHSELTSALKQLAQSEKTTLFMTLLAVFQILLYRYSGQPDFAIGTPTAGRNRAETEGLIGFFVNTLVLRAKLQGSPTFRELLARVKETTLDAYAHAEAPFEKLVEELHPQRDLSRNPLVQVTFQLFNPPVPIRNGGPAAESVRPAQLMDIPKPTAKFDLALEMWEEDSGLRGRLEYSSDLYDASTIRRLLDHFEVLLTAAVSEPAKPIDALPVLTRSEFERQVVEWNRTEHPYRRDARVIELFEQQAARTPDSVAIIDGTVRISYAELARRVDAAAANLQAAGVRPGELVGVCLKRGAGLIATLLAVWKAGAAYVPLDPAYPAQRLDYMFADSGAAFAIRESGIHRCASSESAHDLPKSAAYVLYTSGSTGLPKGVAIGHRSAVALIDWALNFYSRQDLSGVLASTSVCFDLSIFEIFVPLSGGGAVIVAENAMHLASLPAAGDVTLINTVPSAIAELARLRAIPDSVRTINLAGEPLHAELPALIFSSSQVAAIQNLYGPTEDTTYSTRARIERGETWTPTIGRPLDNRQAYILDSRLQPVPIGVTGELYLGGEGVALGYLNRPELTAERFLDSPFSSGARLYKTGDLARYRYDGNIEYIGRTDSQVKLRGFRIELGEIESALRRCAGVRDAAVVMRENVAGERFLAGFFVAEHPHPSIADLRNALELSLPHYMIPTVFTPLAAFPLTPNGKLDRAALPSSEPAPAATRVFPRSDLERKLSAIWSEALGVSEPGIDESFFELGGHSLLLLRVQARIQESLADVSIVDLFRYPSIRALAAHLGESGVASESHFSDATQRGRKQRERLHARHAMRSS